MLSCLKSATGQKYTFADSDRLGAGAFGDVYLGTIWGTDKKVAIKRINNSVLERYGEEFVRCIGNEANLLQEMNFNEKTVKIYDCFQTPNHVCIIMEFCEGGTLEKIVKNNGGKLNEKAAVGYLAEIVEGLYVMHSRGFMHRDLKLENIFIKDGKCKIGDFGFATSKPISDQYCGTPYYMAPEMFEVGDGRGYDKQVDIWALGVMFHEMLFGERPYVGPQTQLLDIIKKNPYKAPNFVQISDESKDLLGKMLTIDPKKRITVKEIIKHPVFQKVGVSLSISDVSSPMMSSINGSMDSSSWQGKT